MHAILMTVDQQVAHRAKEVLGGEVSSLKDVSLFIVRTQPHDTALGLLAALVDDGFCLEADFQSIFLQM